MEVGQLLLGAVEVLDQHFMDATDGRRLGAVMTAVDGVPVVLVDLIGHARRTGLIGRALHFAAAAQRLRAGHRRRQNRRRRRR